MFPIIDLLNSSFMAEYKNRVNVEAKEFREIALYRMSTTLRETSYLVSSSVTIPVGDSSTYVITPGTDSIVALVPVFNTDGEADYDTDTGETTFNAYAYALIPRNEFYSGYTGSDKVLVESSTSFSCAVESDDHLTPTSDCTTDWTSSGTTNVIFDDAIPASFANYASPFDINSSRNYVKAVFGVKNGKIYFPDDTADSIDDKYLESIDIWCRNVST